ncbi:unnamed protein product, partial [Allacma fusca]
VIFKEAKEFPFIFVIFDRVREREPVSFQGIT